MTIPLADLAGREYSLSEIQADGSDPVVRGTTWDEDAGP